MASTPFRVISWSKNDPVVIDKLSAMTDNDQWLRDNMARGLYRANGVRLSSGIRIASGLALIPASKSATRQKFVSFGDYFSESCKPIVTHGTNSSAQRRIFVTIDGPGSTPLPTRDGFQVHVEVEGRNKKSKISRNFYVSWIAVGY